MGSRTISKKKCPVCEKFYETYDAPSSMMYVAKCDCGYDEGMEYFEMTNALYLIPRNVKKYIDELESREFSKEELR
jgi:hypothetical protein